MIHLIEVYRNGAVVSIRGKEIGFPILIQVPGSDRSRSIPGRIFLHGPEGSIPSTWKHGHTAGATIHYREIQLPVVIKVANDEGSWQAPGRVQSVLAKAPAKRAV